MKREDSTVWALSRLSVTDFFPLVGTLAFRWTGWRLLIASTSALTLWSRLGTTANRRVDSDRLALPAAVCSHLARTRHITPAHRRGQPRDGRCCHEKQNDQGFCRERIHERQGDGADEQNPYILQRRPWTVKVENRSVPHLPV